MAMPMVAPRYTIADLEQFPDDGNRYELLGGVLLVTPMAEYSHQAVLGRIHEALVESLRPGGTALILSPGAIQIGNDTQLEPDLLVIPKPMRGVAKWREIREWWLAVEVTGPSSRIYDRDFKTGAYLMAGVREVWRVDLRERTVYVSRPGGQRDEPHREQLTWSPPGSTAPLSLDLAALFDC